MLGSLLLAACSASGVIAALSPSSILQSIELSGSLTRTSTSYALKPSAGDALDQPTEWTVGVKGYRTGFVEAHTAADPTGTGKKVKLALTVVSQSLTDGDVPITYYTVSLPSSDSQIVTVSSVSSHIARPRPAILPQRADSLLLYVELDLASAIAGLAAAQCANVQDLKVKVRAPSPRIGEVKGPEGGEWDVSHTKGGATVTFTSKLPGRDVKGQQIASIHYAQPEAMGSVRTLDRIVEVSHWGSNLAVQDNIDLTNVGPKLEGHFSRLDHQRLVLSRRVSPLSISALTIPLPPNVHSAYFYDTVGNVSTSRFRPSPKKPSSAATLLPSQRKKLAGQSLLELQPRYPIMGGWNYSFTVGYDQPLGDVLKQRTGHSYLLAVPFLSPIKDTPVDYTRLEVRLPEGATNVLVSTPFPVDSQSTDGPLAKTYLDAVGRPTVVLTKKDCSDRCGQDVLISYDLSVVRDGLQKPLAIALVSVLMFLLVVAIRRTDWAIPAPLGQVTDVGKIKHRKKL